MPNRPHHLVPARGCAYFPPPTLTSASRHCDLVGGCCEFICLSSTLAAHAPFLLRALPTPVQCAYCLKHVCPRRPLPAPSCNTLSISRTDMLALSSKRAQRQPNTGVSAPPTGPEHTWACAQRKVRTELDHLQWLAVTVENKIYHRTWGHEWGKGEGAAGRARPTPRSMLGRGSHGTRHCRSVVATNHSGYRLKICQSATEKRRMRCSRPCRSWPRLWTGTSPC